MWGAGRADMALGRVAIAPEGLGAFANADADAGWPRSSPLWLLTVAGTVLAFAAGVGADIKPKLAFAAVAAVVLIVIVAVRPLVGGLILVCIVPVVSGLAPGFPVPYVRISEALTGIVGTTVIVATRSRLAVRWDLLDWLLLGYCLAWAGFGIVDAHLLGEHLSMSLWGTVFGQLQFFLIYRGVRVSIRTANERKLAVAAMLVATVPVALLALMQQLRIGAVGRFIDHITGSAPSPAWAGLQRATGPFDNWAALAGYLFPLLLVAASLALAGETGPRKRAFAVVIGLAALALLLTAELSAIICLLIGIVFLGYRFGRGRELTRWFLLSVGAAALVTGPFIGARLTGELSKTAGSGRSSLVPQTIAFRQQVWTAQYLPAIEARPLTGYGVVAPTTISWQYPESEYVTLAMEGGLPLLLLFGALTVAVVDRARRAGHSRDPLRAALGRALVVATIGIVAMDTIWPYMSNGGLPQLFWCLAALALPRRSAWRCRSRVIAAPRAST